MEQLSSLAETGQVDPQTAYYDVEREEWLPIAANEALRAALFPEKRKLRVKPKEITNALNTSDPNDRKEKAITVTDMLDAAEGLTADTQVSVTKTLTERTRGAAMGAQLCALALLLHACALLIAERDVLLGADLTAMLVRPLTYAAVADIVLCVVLALGVIEAYPVVRFRAAAMIGFLTFTFLSAGTPLVIVAAAVTAVGVYALTYLTLIRHVVIAGAIALGGSLWLAWQMFQF